MTVVEANRSARHFFGQDVNFQIGWHCGDTICCFHEIESGMMCGQTQHCSDCVLRNSVEAVLTEDQVIRKRSKMFLGRNGQAHEINILLTVWSISLLDETKLAGVMVEDLSALFQLGQPIPICAWCKKIRPVEKVWMRVEDYIKTNLGLDFTHTICLECRKKLNAELKK